jgi:hypothetical protein
LRDRSPNTPGPVQPKITDDNNKIKRKGKQIKQDANDLDFKNKRSGWILSRMTRNQCQNHSKLIPTVVIEDTNFVDDVRFDSTRVDSPQYDFVSNLPLFLRDVKDLQGYKMI